MVKPNQPSKLKLHTHLLKHWKISFWLRLHQPHLRFPLQLPALTFSLPFTYRPISLINPFPRWKYGFSIVPACPHLNFIFFLSHFPSFFDLINFPFSRFSSIDLDCLDSGADLLLIPFWRWWPRVRRIGFPLAGLCSIKFRRRAGKLG